MFGAIAGAIVGGAMIALVMFFTGSEPGMLGMVLGYLSMLIALTAVFVGVKRHRDEALGGVIAFLPALGMGLAISIVAGLIYVLAWEATLVVTGMDFAGDFARAMIAQARASGAKGAALAKAIADARAFEMQYRDPLIRMPMTFMEIAPVGLLVSLLAAALLRNPRFMPARDLPASSG